MGAPVLQVGNDLHPQGCAPWTSSEETTLSSASRWRGKLRTLRSFFLSPRDPLRWARAGAPLYFLCRQKVTKELLKERRNCDAAPELCSGTTSPVAAP